VIDGLDRFATALDGHVQISLQGDESQFQSTEKE